MRTILLALCLIGNYSALGQDIRIGILDEKLVWENSIVTTWMKEEIQRFQLFLTDFVIAPHQEICQNYYQKILEHAQRSCPTPSEQIKMEKELQKLQENLIFITLYTDTVLIKLEYEFIEWYALKQKQAIDSISIFYKYNLILSSKIILAKSLSAEEEIQKFSKEVVYILNQTNYSEFQTFSNLTKTKWIKKIAAKKLYPSKYVADTLYNKGIFSLVLLYLIHQFP